MLPSVLVNAALAVCAVAAVWGHTKKAPLKIILRYFTALSNLFCALCALAVVVCRACGSVPNTVLILKFVGTAAVTVTMLTVLAFLGPTLGYRMLLTGPDLWLHLICPVLAIGSYALWDRPKMPFAAALLGVLPVLAYGGVYIRRVLFAPEERRWKDFYGFNRGGKWRLSFTAMLLGAFLVSIILWLV